jgi:hypothetical protein
MRYCIGSRGFSPPRFMWRHILAVLKVLFAIIKELELTYFTAHGDPG